MVEPDSQVTKVRTNHFVPDEKIAVFVSTSKYDAVMEVTESVKESEDGEEAETHEHVEQKYQDII